MWPTYTFIAGNAFPQRPSEKVHVRYMLGTCWSNIYPTSNPLYIEVSDDEGICWHKNGANYNSTKNTTTQPHQYAYWRTPVRSYPH